MGSNPMGTIVSGDFEGVFGHDDVRLASLRFALRGNPSSPWNGPKSSLGMPGARLETNVLFPAMESQSP